MLKFIDPSFPALGVPGLDGTGLFGNKRDTTDIERFCILFVWRAVRCGGAFVDS